MASKYAEPILEALFGDAAKAETVRTNMNREHCIANHLCCQCFNEGVEEYAFITVRSLELSGNEWPFCKKHAYGYIESQC